MSQTRFGRARTRRRHPLLWLLVALLPLEFASAESLAWTPPRPQVCQSVAVGSDLQAQLDSAAPGTSLCLEDGDYVGPLSLPPGVTLWGTRRATIRALGEGTTVRVDADGAALLGVSVDGSGGRFDLLDAAVHASGEDVRVEGVAVHGALFGILVEKARRAKVRHNLVVGPAEKALGLRGDGIRLWEVRESRVEDNQMRHSRDLVIWYSPGNRILRNQVEHGRYGTHFMYSHDNVVEDNRYVGNVVGIFVMYSRNLRIHGNLIARSAGAAGMGLGAKDSGNLDVRRNVFIANADGVYLDTSPLYHDEHNHFEQNVFRLGDTAVVFHSSPVRNAFTGNSFQDNSQVVRVEGRGDALKTEWQNNYFDDYAGYDLDGDGVGDVAYEVRSLSAQLTAREPALAFFRGSPAMALVELVGKTVPLFQPRTLLVDPRPSTENPTELATHAH